MNINKKHFQTIWPDTHCKHVNIIDQTKLPFNFSIKQLNSLNEMIYAIKAMQVRGAPLIGVSAAYGMALAMLEDDSDTQLITAADRLIQSRPTAVNLSWAVNRVVDLLKPLEPKARNLAAWKLAATIAEEDVKQNQMIGRQGLQIIENAYKGDAVNILTHCNAGWLATVDYGTALSPVFSAHDAGVNVHVWVDETRPRNQGASLTAWELAQHGVPHTVITDNAGGHLMQKGLVDMVLVGADRVAANGDVCNKVGTYLKALAAADCHIPFYVAVPKPTIDFLLPNGNDIQIEMRSGDEVAFVQGEAADGSIQCVRIMPKESASANPAFDVTPARLVTSIITEQGVFSPDALLQEVNT